MSTLERTRDSAVPSAAAAGRTESAGFGVAVPTGSLHRRIWGDGLPLIIPGSPLWTSGLGAAEALLRVAQPVVIGLAINDLLDSSVRGLLVLVIQHLLLMGALAGRRMYDGRICAAQEADLPGHNPWADTSWREWGVQSSSTLTGPDGALRNSLERIIVIAGSLLVLGWYDATLLPFCLLLIVPIALLRAAGATAPEKMSGRGRRQEQDLTRETSTTRRRELHRSRETDRHLRVQRADAAAIRGALTDLFVLGMLASAIVHYLGCGETSPPPGDIFAVVSSLLLFVGGLKGESARTWA